MSEPAENICGECGHECCRFCLVYPWGRHQAPYCHSCALALAGVRSTARRNRLGPKRQIRKESETRARERAREQWAAPTADPDQILIEDDWVVSSES
ncbi:MAG: hypothetical protein GY745_13625 [Actinomycetia bacterium]|nr:hypothetical protein [Actinomycetes bacterium]MCP4086077.1 hypothetical protein [Actinomycetes bacterium]